MLKTAVPKSDGPSQSPIFILLPHFPEAGTAAAVNTVFKRICVSAEHVVEGTNASNAFFFISLIQTPTKRPNNLQNIFKYLL